MLVTGHFIIKMMSDFDYFKRYNQYVCETIVYNNEGALTLCASWCPMCMQTVKNIATQYVYID